MYALVDGNNYYVSCQRVFRPSLQGLPVVVLSKTTAARLPAATRPRLWTSRWERCGSRFATSRRVLGWLALSANFVLYCDMSDRVMSLAASMGPSQELYSIDKMLHRP